MAERKPQTFANHRRFEPLYHVVTFGLLAINLIWRLVQVVRLTSWPTVFDLLLAFAPVVYAAVACYAPSATVTLAVENAGVMARVTRRWRSSRFTSVSRNARMRTSPRCSSTRISILRGTTWSLASCMLLAAPVLSSSITFSMFCGISAGLHLPWQVADTTIDGKLPGA